MPFPMISTEAFVRRIRTAILAGGPDVQVAPGVKAAFDGKHLRFVHVDESGEPLTTNSIHVSDRIAEELRSRRNRDSLSGGAKSRLIGGIQSLHAVKFRGAYPFRPLVGMPVTQMSTPTSPLAALAI